MLYRPEQGRMWDPSIFPWNGELWMLSMHYDGGIEAPGTGMWLARSKDGVHWTGVGRVLEDPAGLFKMYASKTADGRIFLNYGSTSTKDNPYGDNDTLKYYTSDDLIHWKREYENHPDSAWYNPQGRWDHMYVYEENGTYYGYPVATPRPELRTCIGLQKSADGLNWTCVQPPAIEWGDVPPIDMLETGGMEKIGDEYYYVAGYVGYAGSYTYNVYVFRADSPEGPFRPDTQAFRLCGADGLPQTTFVSNLACLFKLNGEMMCANAVSAPGVHEVWLLPVRRVLRDEDGHLRLAWWEGNETLKGDRIVPGTPEIVRGDAMLDMGEGMLRAWIDVPDMPTQTDKTAMIRLCGTEFEAGMYLTGKMICRSAPPRHDDIHKTHCWRPARIGFAVGKEDGSHTAITLDVGPAYRRKSNVLDLNWQDGKMHMETLDVMGEDYAGVKGISAEEEHTFRLLIRRNMQELYVDDLLVQTWAVNEPLDGSVSLYIQNASCELRDLQYHKMSI